MRSELYGRDIMNTIMSFINKFTAPVYASPEHLDAFQHEVSRLERQLAKRATRPLDDTRRSPRFTEPITEQQKIMDMSG